MLKIKYISFILALLLTSALFAQDYELNLKVVQNDRTIAGTFSVVVQVRATPSKGSFIAHGFTQLLIFNDNALDFTAGSATYLGNFATHGLVPQSTQNQGSNSVELGRGFFLTPPNLTVTTAWQDVVQLDFTIVDPNEILNMRDLGPGLEPRSQVFDEWIGPGTNDINTLTFGGGFTSVSYDGTSWTGGNGAGGAPDATDAAKEIIVQSGVATLTGDVECDYFEVAAGADLVVGPNATLRPWTQSAANGYNIVDGVDGFLVDADATGYGQYLGPGLPGEIKQYVGTDQGWRNVAFPVSGGTNFALGGAPAGFGAASTSATATPVAGGDWGNYINTVNVYTFNNEQASRHEWYGAAAAPTGGTDGYNIFAGGSNFGTNGEFGIQGTFLDPSTAGTASYSHNAPHANGTGSQALQSTDVEANWDGWELVANPYPCNLDAQEFATANGLAIEQVRVWDRSQNVYVNFSGSGVSGANPSVPSAGSGVIAPMQAFWIKTGTAPSTANITYPEAVRTLGTGTFFKTAPQQVALIASNTSTNEAKAIHLRFDPRSTNGYDKAFDAYVFNQPGATHPQLAFHNSYNVGFQNVVAPLDYNTVPVQPNAVTSYPLRFWARSAGTFSYTVDQSLLNPAWKVYIEDLKTAPGTHVEITNSSYQFSYDPAVDSPERFVLHFADNAASVGLGDQVQVTTWQAAAFFNNQGELVVSFEGELPGTVDAQIYDASGRLMFADQEVSTADQLKVANSYKPGIYFIHLGDRDGEQRVIRANKVQ
jgi:hypothetical protein